ncbi:MAG: transposase [Deltaproteobacteria bacterium]|nr:transposase [Deltaproteobacteria bacterium]
MEWIDKISYVDNQWKLKVLENEDTHWEPLNYLSSLKDRCPPRPRRKLTSVFSSWKPYPSFEFAARAGIKQQLSDNHTIYSFNEDGVTYLVPAAVIIEAILRPIKFIGPWLFQLEGLAQFSVPSEGDRVRLSANASSHIAASDGLKDLLTWVWHYPSAGLMWSSVYKFASQERINIDLPIGCARLICRGVSNGNVFLVGHLFISQVWTTEEPRCANTGLSDKTKIVLRPSKASDRPSELPKRDQIPLSDLEWESIADLFERQRVNTRQIIDDILEKQATGVPWYKAQFRTGHWKNAHVSLRRWHQSGKWDEVCKRLSAVRGLMRTPDC